GLHEHRRRSGVGGRSLICPADVPRNASGRTVWPPRHGPARGVRGGSAIPVPIRPDCRGMGAGRRVWAAAAVARGNAEPVAPADGAGLTAFQAPAALQPGPLLSPVVELNRSAVVTADSRRLLTLGPEFLWTDIGERLGLAFPIARHNR